jgi:hypothetical protein
VLIISFERQTEKHHADKKAVIDIDGVDVNVVDTNDKFVSSVNKI